MSFPRKTPQGGFTLIELVVVIVIIGILAAFAIPRFANIAQDARISSVNGLLGSVRSTSALVHGLALARNTADGAAINLEGSNVTIQRGYPAGTVAGIGNALTTTAGYTLDASTAGTVVFQVNGAATLATCSVTYVEPAGPGLAPTITSATAGC